MDLSRLADDLQPVMRDAGDEILRIYDRGPDADFKEDGSPVCAADQAADRILLDALARFAPGIAVVSEENAASHHLAPRTRFFLVDPLDGTKEFLKRDGNGAYTVNIALIEDGAPIMGLVFAPALDRMFVGIVSKGSVEIQAGQKKHISCRVAGANKVALASASHRDSKTNEWLAAHGIAETVAIGSSLKFGLLASAEADVYPRFSPTMEWDTAAGDAILRAAGGKVTNPDGTPMMYGKPEYRNGPFIASGAS